MSESEPFSHQRHLEVMLELDALWEASQARERFTASVLAWAQEQIERQERAAVGGKSPPPYVSAPCAECKETVYVEQWRVRDRETGKEITHVNTPHTGKREAICPPCAKKLWPAGA